MNIVVEPSEAWTGPRQDGDWLCLIAEGDQTYRLVAANPDHHPDGYIPLAPLLDRPDLRPEDAETLQDIVAEYVSADPEILDGTRGNSAPEIDLLEDRIPATWDPATWLQGETAKELIADYAHHLVEYAKKSDNVRLRGGVAAVQKLLTKRFSEELSKSESESGSG